MIFRFCTYPLYVSCCPKMSFESPLTYPSSDKPSQPGTPEITDYDEESVGFRWAPSQSDGGSPITHYIIQMKLNGKDWERLDDFKTPTGNESLTYKHIGLSLKDKVQYRTIAVNKAGESPPSEPSPVHTVKHKKRKLSTSNFLRGSCSKSSPALSVPSILYFSFGRSISISSKLLRSCLSNVLFRLSFQLYISALNAQFSLDSIWLIWQQRCHQIRDNFN